MQIKTTRGTTTTGLISKTQVFTITMIAAPTPEEHALIGKWGKWESKVGDVITEYGDQKKFLYDTTLSSLLSGHQWVDASLRRLEMQEKAVLKHTSNILNWCLTADAYAQGQEKLHQVEPNESAEI